MSRLLLLAILCLSATAQDSWLSVEDGDSSWFNFIEASSRTEFWFRPRPSLLSSKASCSSPWRVRFEVDVWDSETLSRAGRALRSRGLCDSGCRVLPLPVSRVGLRALGSVQWRWVTGVIPRRLLFEFPLAKTNGSCSGWREDDAGQQKARVGAVVLEMEALRSRATRTVLLSFPETRSGVADVEALLDRTLASVRLQGEDLTSKSRSVLLSQLRDSMRANKSALRLWGRLVREPDLNWVRVSVAAGDNNPALLTSSVPTLNPTTTKSPVASKKASGQPAGSLEQLRQQISALQRDVERLSGKTKTQGKSRTSSVNSIMDCAEILTQKLPAGIYQLSGSTRKVRCTDSGELVALSRTEGNVDFNRPWKDYAEGFGEPGAGDYWVGLRFLANYTRAGDRCMRLQIAPWRMATEMEARYSDVMVGAEKDKFPLSYRAFKGSVARDGLAEMNGQPFSTRDRDNDEYVGNCAEAFAGGNWYRSCAAAHLFGVHKYVSGSATNARRAQSQSLGQGMCWKGVKDINEEVCAPLVALKMIFSRVMEHGTGRNVFVQKFASTSTQCRSQITLFTVNVTGQYHVTVGGGAGGASSKGTPGGRGAVVKGQVLLRKGEKLAFVVGCGGLRGLSNGNGGNATMILDATSWRPIIVAGGGGGASERTPGGHGQANKTGGQGWWLQDYPTFLNSSFFLRPTLHRGSGWSVCSREKKGVCTTGQLTHQYMRVLKNRSGRYYFTTVVVNAAIKGGGGGGGFEGGESGTKVKAAGGGGGSFCRQGKILDCRIEEGGNRHQVGFVILEKKMCF